MTLKVEKIYLRVKRICTFIRPKQITDKLYEMTGYLVWQKLSYLCLGSRCV